MPYCAECLIEYLQGTAQCEDCGAFLLAGSPPASPPHSDLTHEKDGNLVSVRITALHSAMGYEVVRGILEAHGIPCMLSGDTAADPLVGHIHLLVREDDVTRVERILKRYAEGEVLSPPNEPSPVGGSSGGKLRIRDSGMFPS